MTVISLINYREITTLAELKALFQNNVVSIDFEFTPSTFEPFAYGYCLDKRVKGFRFSHVNYSAIELLSIWFTKNRISS